MKKEDSPHANSVTQLMSKNSCCLNIRAHEGCDAGKLVLKIRLVWSGVIHLFLEEVLGGSTFDL